MTEPSSPSIRSALRRSARAGLGACRELGGAARQATTAVTAAIAEERGVVRTVCVAAEQGARTAIRATRSLEEQSVAAWRSVPLIGPAASRIIASAAWIAVSLLSALVSAMIACDVLLNTATTERIT
jgi:hypothetical protein